MLKYLLFSLLLAPTICSATTWITLNDYNKGGLNIIDKDSIVRKNDFATYRMKDNSMSDSYSIIYFKSNCTNKTRTILKRDYYSNSNELIKTIVFHDIKYGFYVRNQDTAKLENIVCENSYY